MSQHPSIAEIRTLVAARFGLRNDEIIARNQCHRVAHPRQVAIYLARKLTHKSSGVIGRHIGGLTSWTVRFACHQVEARCAEDDGLRGCVNALADELASR